MKHKRIVPPPPAGAHPNDPGWDVAGDVIEVEMEEPMTETIVGRVQLSPYPKSHFDVGTKFIQILEGSGEFDKNGWKLFQKVIALDAAGQVWEYQGPELGWAMFNMTRKEDAS